MLAGGERYGTSNCANTITLLHSASIMAYFMCTCATHKNMRSTKQPFGISLGLACCDHYSIHSIYRIILDYRLQPEVVQVTALYQDLVAVWNLLQEVR